MKLNLHSLICAGLGLLAAHSPEAVRAVESTGTSTDYLLNVWRSEDGLPDNAVISLAQTPDGYIWIGTRSGGLARFDGTRFVSFTPQNTPELPDVEIEKLTVDRTGTMWIVTGNESLSTYRDGHFFLVRSQHAEPRWHPISLAGNFTNGAVFWSRGMRLYEVPLGGPLNQVTQLSPRPAPATRQRDFRLDGQGILWYLGRTGNLCAFNGQSFDRFLPAAISISAPFEDLAVDPLGQMWLANATSLARWQDGKFTSQTPTNGPPPSSIRRLVPAGDGSVWVCETGRIRRMRGKEWLATGYAGLKLPNWASDTLQVFGDREGGLWCLSYGEGLLHLQPNGQAHLLTEADGLPSRQVTAWLQDDEGNIWVGTLDGGLVRIRPRVFQVYGSAQGLPSESVLSVCEDAQGVIWAGTVSGQLARRTGNHFEAVPLTSTNRNEDKSVTVFPDPDGSLWVGRWQLGLMQLRGKDPSETWEQTMISSVPVRVLMADSARRIWLGSGSGLRVWQNGAIRLLDATGGFKDRVGIGAMSEAPSGTVWIGSSIGELWRYRDDQFTHFPKPDNWPPARCSAMLAESNGVVWIGTLGDGLLRFENGIFARISSAQGLPDDFITQLLDDQQGYLWAGTHNGIYRLEKAALNLVAEGNSQAVVCFKFDRYDGLPTMECGGGFFQPAAWRARDGTLWFATLKGLVSVNPSSAKLACRPPPVRIEQISVDGTPCPFALSTRAAANDSPLQIAPGHHALQIRFTAFNYIRPDDLQFRWMLEGVDSVWHESGSERLVNIAPLPPGQYRFRVMAATSSSGWNDNGAMLAFTIRPHLWETWWFKAFVIAAIFMGLMLLVGLSVRHRYRLRLERLERDRQIDLERVRIARDLHDDLGASLTQISLMSALISRGNTPLREIMELTLEIRAKSRRMASSLNEIVWAVNPRNDSLNDVLGYFGDFAGEFLGATAIRCRLDLPDPVSDFHLSTEVRHNLYLAFKEALNNAAKYAHATEITLIARESAREVIVSLRDNGQGFAPTPLAGRKGNGLRNMRERLESIGGRCEIESVLGKGTTVNFHLRK